MIHLMRVFISAAYRGAKKGLWTVGVVLAAVVFGLSITGETLHWDERGFAVPWHVGEFFEAIGLADATRIQAMGSAEDSRAEAVGLAQAKAIEAQGVATAQGFEAQKQALGEGATALVNAIKAIAEGQIKVVPEVLVAGSGGSIEGLAASLIKLVRDRPALPVESSDAA